MMTAEHLQDRPDRTEADWAASYLAETDPEVMEALEGMLADLASVQNFAQLRKAMAERREGIISLLADREKAREILRA